jgi:hypothetical protein
MSNEPQEPSEQSRTRKSLALLRVATAATGASILLLEKVVDWLRHLGTPDDSAITLLPLTPRYDAEKHGVYFEALDHALKSRKEPVLNVALTGSYGVGKSSILEEFARRNSRKVTAISLSTLGFPEEADTKTGTAAKATTKTNRIQKEIVKQLLYSQDPVKMPGSRCRRMTRFRFWRELGLSALLTVPITLVFYLAGWTESLAKLIPLPTEWALLIHGFVFITAVSLIMGFRSVFHNRIQIDKITAGSATISLSAKSTTYFDEYLDEIVYFFEIIKRDIVIFEDIDRFDDAHIFETLRSLNGILNGAQQLKRRRIQFVYAIKDSIFDELGARAAKEELDAAEKQSTASAHDDVAEAEVARANRTKFFDLVIPVVPFITHRSARDLIVDTMKDIDSDISNDLIDMAARHVADMRLIKNVRNEFAIFKRQVIDTGDLDLEHDKLFAMMLYKSTHLSDFELIKLGKSNIDNLYQDSRELVATNVKALNTKIRRTRAARSKARISAEHSKVLGDSLLKHIKVKLWEVQGQGMQSFALNQKPVAESALGSAGFWDELAKTDGTLAVTFYHPSWGSRTLALTRAEIAEALGEPISSKDWVDAELARFDGEIRQALADREFLTRADMSALMGRNETLERGGKSITFAQLAKQQLKSELAEQLVAAGYIERNFTLYTSTFHGERTSANATNFMMKNIEQNVTDMFFTLTGDDVDAIIREKGQAILRERSAYNISVLDRLLGGAPEAADILTGQLRKDGDAEREFLLAYLEGGHNREALVRDLAGKWPNPFTVLITDAQLDEQTCQQLVNAALLSLSSDVEYVFNNDARDYIVGSYASLSAFTDDETTQTQATRIGDLIKKAGVKLPLIDPLGSNVLTAIVAYGSYDLTRANLRTALAPDHGLNLDAIAQTSRPIYDRVLAELPGYLAALHANESTVVSPDLFIGTIKDVSEAAEEHLPEIISRAAENCRVTELADVSPKAWPPLAKGLRFPATFMNVRAYINQYGLDSSLAGVLNDAGKIDVDEDAEEPTKVEVALTILGAKNEIPSAPFRAELVDTLQLEDHLQASMVPHEPGELIGCLIAENVIADDADTFAAIKRTDAASLVFSVSKSKKFASFMTPAQVTPHLAAIISSEVVPAAVKEAIVDRFDEFTTGASRGALANIADYALKRDKHLAFTDVARLAIEGVEATTVLSLLQTHLPSLGLSQLSPVLNALGGKYPELSEANGKRPSIANTDTHQALADHLRMLGVVSSVEDRGAELRVNMRRRQL